MELIDIDAMLTESEDNAKAQYDALKKQKPAEKAKWQAAKQAFKLCRNTLQDQYRKCRDTITRKNPNLNDESCANFKKEEEVVPLGLVEQKLHISLSSSRRKKRQAKKEAKATKKEEKKEAKAEKKEEKKEAKAEKKEAKAEKKKAKKAATTKEEKKAAKADYKDAKKDNREAKQEAKQDKREGKQEARQDYREAKQEAKCDSGTKGQKTLMCMPCICISCSLPYALHLHILTPTFCNERNTKEVRKEESAACKEGQPPQVPGQQEES